MNWLCVVAFQLVGLLVLLELNLVQGHGRLMNPVGRSSRWRFNESAIANYNDNEGFCGGYGVQYGKYKGKCGLCGDSYGDKVPRDNELGGLYGEGVIVKTYVAGTDVQLVVDITANHYGYFVFDICNLADGGESEECFAKHILELTTGGYKYVLTVFTAARFTIPVKIPADLVCEHCVLRWTYYTANSWGDCEDGTGAIGCGNQEFFKGCADISISK